MALLAGLVAAVGVFGVLAPVVPAGPTVAIPEWVPPLVVMVGVAWFLARWERP